MNTKLLEKVQNPLCDALGMLGDVAGATISAVGQHFANEQTFEHNKQLMGLQFDYGEQAADNAQRRLMEINQHNWEKYNSYEAQRASMEAAGLSPALLYGGKGQGGTGMASAAPQGGGAGLPNTPVGNVGLAAVQGAQLGLITAQTRETNARAAKTEGETDPAIRLLTAQADIEEMNADIKSATQYTEITRILDEALMKRYEVRSLGIDLHWKRELFFKNINPLLEQTRNIIADSWLKAAQQILAQHQTNLTDKQWQKVDAEIRKLDSETDYLNLQKDWYVSRIFIDAGIELGGEIIKGITGIIGSSKRKPTQITQTTNNDNRGADQTRNTTINNNGPQY